MVYQGPPDWKTIKYGRPDAPVRDNVTNDYEKWFARPLGDSKRYYLMWKLFLSHTYLTRISCDQWDFISEVFLRSFFSYLICSLTMKDNKVIVSFFCVVCFTKYWVDMVVMAQSFFKRANGHFQNLQRCAKIDKM